MTQATEPADRGMALTPPIAILLLVQLAGGMMLSSQRTFFPVYVKELGHPAMLISSLAAARLAMGMVASLVGGTLSDLLGRKWTLLLGNLGFLVGSLLFLTPSAGWIGVLWALSGFGSGLHTLGGQSYLVDASAPRYLGVFAAFYNWGFTLGGALSSPAAGFLLDRWGYAAFGSALRWLSRPPCARPTSTRSGCSRRRSWTTSVTTSTTRGRSPRAPSPIATFSP